MTCTQNATLFTLTDFIALGAVRLRLSTPVSVSKLAVLVTFWHGPRRKHRFLLLSYSIVAVQLLRLYKHACLRGKQ
jgi:hypothetical protein